MTIERGAAWGEPMEPPADLVVAETDAELALLAAEALTAGQRLVAEVRAGDLLRSLGLDRPRPPSQRHGYPVDLGLVTLDESAGPLPFVAHAVARRRLWAGQVVVIMNVGWLDELRLGPRAHPNDGLLDITAGRLPPTQRLEARRRARTGTHVPHPALTTTRASRWQTTFPLPTPIRLDGVARGRTRSLAVELVPDALTVVV